MKKPFVASTAFASLVLLLAACSSNRMAASDPIYWKAGRSAGELSAAWWQWAMAAPEASNPVQDATGEYCSVGQQGNVWFLAGGFGSSRITRHCAIPAGKFLFFPIITTVYWPAEGEILYTCAQARRSAAANNDAARDLFVALDGAALGDPKRFRAASDCFNIMAKADASAHPYQAYPSAADGYWVLLPPLAPGQHTLRFGGRYDAPDERGGGTMEDIEYDLMVQGPQ